MDAALKKEYTKYFREIFNFMVENGYTCMPAPKVILRDAEQDCEDILAKTGYFDPNLDAIVIFVRGRGIKDCARTFAHELIHWKQRCDGALDEFGYTSDKITEDENLIKLEAEAYLKGNLAFRSWTEEMQRKGK